MRTKSRKEHLIRGQKENLFPQLIPWLILYDWFGSLSLTFPIIYVGFALLAPLIRYSRAVTTGIFMDKPESSQMMIYACVLYSGSCFGKTTNRESIPDARSPGLMQVRLQYHYAVSWHFRSNETHVSRMVETKGEVSFLFLWSSAMLWSLTMTS